MIYSIIWNTSKKEVKKMQKIIKYWKKLINSQMSPNFFVKSHLRKRQGYSNLPDSEENDSSTSVNREQGYCSFTQ
jgi:hypothetical protein